MHLIQTIMIFILLIYIETTVNYKSIDNDMNDLNELSKNVAAKIDRSFEKVTTPYITDVFIIDGINDCQDSATGPNARDLIGTQHGDLFYFPWSGVSYTEKDTKVCIDNDKKRERDCDNTKTVTQNIGKK